MVSAKRRGKYFKMLNDLRCTHIELNKLCTSMRLCICHMEHKLWSLTSFLPRLAPSVDFCILIWSSALICLSLNTITSQSDTLTWDRNDFLLPAEPLKNFPFSPQRIGNLCGGEDVNLALVAHTEKTEAGFFNVCVYLRVQGIGELQCEELTIMWRICKGGFLQPPLISWWSVVAHASPLNLYGQWWQGSLKCPFSYRGWTMFLPNSYMEVLPAGTSECDLIRIQVFYWKNKFKMWALGWALSQHDCCLFREGEIGTQEHTQGRWCEDTARRWLSTSQQIRP